MRLRNVQVTDALQAKANFLDVAFRSLAYLHELAHQLLCQMAGLAFGKAELASHDGHQLHCH